MISKRVKPVLVKSKEKTDLLINTLNNKLLYDCLDIIKEHAEYYQLVLISLDTNEKIEEGDYVLWNGQLFKIDSNNAYSNTWNITLGYCRQYNLPKVIATHNQISGKDIYRLVGEYNGGNMNDFEIEMGELYFHGSGYYKAEQLSLEERERYSFTKEIKTKLTSEGYITIVDKDLSLDDFIKAKLSEIEHNHDYSVAMDTVRCWLDEYNDLSKNKLK